MMIKLIIFDWDDVFTLGSKNGYFKCYHETLAELGVVLDPKDEEKRILSKWGKSHQEELKCLLDKRPDLWGKSFKIYEEKLFGNVFIDEIKIIPGASDLLMKINKKYILAVATGMHPRILKDKVMPTFNVPNVFSQIITAYDIDPAKQKPSPYAVQKIMSDQGISSRETVFVGDAENDVLMARAANVTPIVVLTGHLNKKEAKDLKVKHIIENVTNIENILKTL